MVIKIINIILVTVVVVNDILHADIDYRKKIIQEIYFIEKYGIESHLKRIGIQKTKEQYTHSLLGRINMQFQYHQKIIV